MTPEAMIATLEPMTEAVPAGVADLVRDAELRELADWRHGPCVSIFLPTHRAGPQTQQDPIRFRNLLRDAHAELARSGLEAPDASELLAPWQALLGDSEFWQFQADGLALYAAPGFHRRYRVPLDLSEEISVGQVFRLRPLLSLGAADDLVFVLALSQNEVRLYEVTRSTIVDVGLGSTPRSMAEALRFEDPERQLQSRSTGRDTVQFHGHGAGGEVDKQALERFFRAVDRGLESVLDGGEHPLVLATVAYYAPIFRAVSRYPRVLDGCVEGNPERRSLQDLHAAVWSLVEPTLGADTARALQRYCEAPTSRVAADTVAVLTAAREGRVDTLLVTAGPPIWGRVDDSGTVVRRDERSPDLQDLTDRAVVDTLRSGAAVRLVKPSDLGASLDMTAVLRF
jgi:hypothetical protein